MGSKTGIPVMTVLGCILKGAVRVHTVHKHKTRDVFVKMDLNQIV